MTGRQLFDDFMAEVRAIAALPDADRDLWAATMLQLAIDLAVDEHGIARVQQWLHEAADALPAEAACAPRGVH